MPWLRAHVIHLALFAAGLVLYGLAAGDRLGRTSAAPHYVLQADAWLHGRLTIDHPVGDDWVKLENVVLDDGRHVRGRRMTSQAYAGQFELVGGGRIPITKIVKSEHVDVYMSFPPVPALLMLPQVMVAGTDAHDVAFAVIFAAATLPLFFSVLVGLREAGQSTRTDRENLLLTALFGFGTVFFYASAQGSVWFCAHVVGVFFELAFVWGAIGARRPVLAGIALGLAACTRPPMAFVFPLFFFEAWRVTGEKRAFVRRAIAFAAPVAAIAIAAAIYNYVRFESPTEFGHKYLSVRQQGEVEVHGLFSYHYLARNLAVAFALLPEIGGSPWIRFPGHGLAIWFTTPALLLCLWPATRPPIHRALLVSLACVAIPALFYQNTGWVQFGYRFGLDWLPLAVLLLAVGGRRFGWGARALVAWSIAWNLVGAATFDRYHGKFYRLDRSEAPDTSAYNVIIAN